MLVTLSEILQLAEAKKCAVGSFNTPNLESIMAVIGAAEELNVPVIIMHAEVHEPMMPISVIGPIMIERAKAAKVPVCVHLDHGETLAYLDQALNIGFTSVMFDGSALPYEENVANTKIAVKLAHAKGASVEAEIGTLGKRELGLGHDDGIPTGDEPKKIYTDPKLAEAFVNETGIDALACSFGTAHGLYLTKPKLDMSVLENVKARVNIPLVMHGGSGVSDEDYAVAIENGICKVNYYTYMNTAGGKASKEYWADDSKPLFYDSMSLVATEAIKEDVKRAIKVFQKIK